MLSAVTVAYGNILEFYILGVVARDIEARHLYRLAVHVLVFLSVHPCGEAYILKGAILEYGSGGCALTVIVVAHRVKQYSAGGGIAYTDTSHVAAALFGRLYLHAVDRGGHIAVPYTHVVDAARHLTADGNAVSR